MAYLEIISGPCKGQPKLGFQASKPSLVIGRDVRPGLCLTGDEVASAKHAAVFRSDDKWVVEDRSSTNGTFVVRNGTRIRVAENEEIHIQSGDIIEIGQSQILFSTDDAPKNRPKTSGVPRSSYTVPRAAKDDNLSGTNKPTK